MQGAGYVCSHGAVLLISVMMKRDPTRTWQDALNVYTYRGFLVIMNESLAPNDQKND